MERLGLVLPRPRSDLNASEPSEAHGLRKCVTGKFGLNHGQQRTRADSPASASQAEGCEFDSHCPLLSEDEE
jgi:hypothetical protein